MGPRTSARRQNLGERLLNLLKFVVLSARLKKAEHKPYSLEINTMTNTNQISAHKWLEISEEYYNEILGAVPPIHMTGTKFICSEPYSSNDNRDELYFVGCVNKKSYYGQYMTIADYKKVVPNMITSEVLHESVMLINGENKKAYEAFLENEHLNNNSNAAEQFIERYKGTYDSTEDYTEQNYQNYYPEELPEWARLHIDFESLALTLFCNHNIYHIDSNDRKIFVFDNP